MGLEDDVVAVLLGGAALAADPPLEATAGPDPVLVWAERDRRAIRMSNAGLLATLVGPGLLVIGSNAQQTLPRGSEPGRVAAGLSLLAAGGIASAVGPAVLLYGTTRSAIALRAQSLDVPITPMLVSVGLFGTAAVGWSAGPARGAPVGQWEGVVALGAYTASVAIAAGQLRAHRVARRDAGWLGVAPAPLPDGSALALHGQW